MKLVSFFLNSRTGHIETYNNIIIEWSAFVNSAESGMGYCGQICKGRSAATLAELNSNTNVGQQPVIS